MFEKLVNVMIDMNEKKTLENGGHEAESSKSR